MAGKKASIDLLMIETNLDINRSEFISENLSEAICIARGYYADVLEKGGFAYRIWMKDVGYERYLSFLKKTKFRSSFVPKIYEHIIGTDFQCVRMELLKSHTEFQGPHNKPRS